MDNNLQPTNTSNQETITQGVQEALFSLEELTLNSTTSIGETKRQLKEAREIVKEAYARNEMFVEQQGRTDAEKKQLQSIKHELNTTNEIAGMLQKIKDLQGELKEKESAVSDYALSYLQMGGRDEIERNGTKYRIVKTAKLIRALS